jgi:hypothetical protein
MSYFFVVSRPDGKTLRAGDQRVMVWDSGMRDLLRT